MRMIFSLGKAPRQRESCPSLVRLCPPTSSTSVVGIKKLVLRIPRIDVILIGHWMAGQVCTIMSIVMYKSKLRMKKIALRILMIICEFFLRGHLRSERSIDLLGSVRGIVNGLEDAL